MYVNEHYRTVSLNCSRHYYHNSGGKFRKAYQYYMTKHPEIDPDTFFTQEDPNDWEAKANKIKAYHNECKTIAVKQKYFTPKE